ncbi:AAA family ATPase [Streptomyces sp. NBC_00572]|uniref:AAA family ATPase n=1 Tax=Streptomyces sp. NBC_00572 TaxID=2903664 RepID=UPI00224F1FDF|nr:AAA family ATPase [Streptomyces sp. NBC_00572]MCX4979699.1 ATP-binding protein [Streptomyces sp. NBC_00572]
MAGPVPAPGAAPGPGHNPGPVPVPAAGGGAPGGRPPIPPPPPGSPYPGQPAGSRLGVHPAVQSGASRPPHAGPPPHSAPPAGPGAPGRYGPGAVPQHSGGQPPRADLTGHVPLPPVSAPLAPPVEHGIGTGAATLAVLLIGPAGAGKTTVARHWAQRRRVPTAHISLDDVREWVCSGFADPQSGWNEHSEAQYRLARRTCGFAARNFLANGISCIVDDAVFPDRPVVGLGGWKRHVGPGLLPVVLLPGLEIVLERNAERSGNRRLSDEEVAAIHGRMAGWYGSGLPIIDNSTYDVETTARVLDDILARAIASPPTW